MVHQKSDTGTDMELRGALRELKEAIAGKKKLDTLDSLIDEL